MVSQLATREFLAGNLQQARTGLAAVFLHQEESTISEHTSRTIFLHVLLSGSIAQWLIDPSSALSAKDLTEALRSTAANLQGRNSASQPSRKRAKAKKR
jgi:hypothetical protein